MRAEWRALCDADDMRIRGKQITVHFANERSHGVRVVDEGDSYLPTAVVAGADDLDPGQDAARAAWRRNRHSSLVGSGSTRRAG